MEVDLIFQIAAIGIIVAVLNQLLVRSGREEQAMMTTLAGLIVVLMMIIRQIDALFQAVKSIFLCSDGNIWNRSLCPVRGAFRGAGAEEQQGIRPAYKPGGSSWPAPADPE